MRDYLKLFTVFDITSHCKLSYGVNDGGIYVVLDVGLDNIESVYAIGVGGGIFFEE